VSKQHPTVKKANVQTQGSAPVTSDVIRRFDRETAWIAAGVLSTLVLAALMLAVLAQDRYRKAGPAEEVVQAEEDLVPNIVTDSKDEVLNGKSFNGKMIPKDGSVAQALAEISPQEKLSSQPEKAASTPTPTLIFTPERNRSNVQANAGSWTSANQPNLGRAIGLKTPRERSRASWRPRFGNVKMRLIALWHESLLRSERTRSWTPFTNSAKGNKKKVSYIAETNH
jgi:hypothetical protein